MVKSFYSLQNQKTKTMDNIGELIETEGDFEKGNSPLFVLFSIAAIGLGVWLFIRGKNVATTR